MSTAVEWFNQQLVDKQIGKGDSRDWDAIFEKAKEIEIYQTDNKVISFAEWLTGTKTIELMEFYEEFEKEFYPKEKL
jgi:hypothetical protein